MSRVELILVIEVLDDYEQDDARNFWTAELIGHMSNMPEGRMEFREVQE